MLPSVASLTGRAVCRFFLNLFLFSQTFCSPEFIEGSDQNVQTFWPTWGLDKMDDVAMLS